MEYIQSSTMVLRAVLKSISKLVVEESEEEIQLTP